MSSVTSTVKEIARIATTSGLSKDVIDLLEKKVVLLTQQITSLETENSNLKLENGQLRNQIQNSQPKLSSFHEEFGVLWKRNKTGFEQTPYCPQCANHPIMFGQPPIGMPIDPFMWQCSKCGFISNFQGRPK